MINYQQHIQPIWDFTPRLDAISNADVTCTNCHTSNNKTTLPAGQLELTSDSSDDEAQHIQSYRELFFNDDGQQLVNGQLVDITRTVPATDDDGNILMTNDDPPQIIFVQEPDPNFSASASMRANGARVSFFMEKMTETEIDAGRNLSTPTVNHANMLTPAELRLIAEYLDAGGQYFNNPFDPAAPQN